MFKKGKAQKIFIALLCLVILAFSLPAAAAEVADSESSPEEITQVVAQENEQDVESVEDATEESIEVENEQVEPVSSMQQPTLPIGNGEEEQSPEVIPENLEPEIVNNDISKNQGFEILDEVPNISDIEWNADQLVIQDELGLHLASGFRNWGGWNLNGFGLRFVQKQESAEHIPLDQFVNAGLDGNSGAFHYFLEADKFKYWPVGEYDIQIYINKEALEKGEYASFGKLKVEAQSGDTTFTVLSMKTTPNPVVVQEGKSNKLDFTLRSNKPLLNETITVKFYQGQEESFGRFTINDFAGEKLTKFTVVKNHTNGAVDYNAEIDLTNIQFNQPVAYSAVANIEKEDGTIEEVYLGQFKVELPDMNLKSIGVEDKNGDLVLGVHRDNVDEILYVYIREAVAGNKDKVKPLFEVADDVEVTVNGEVQVSGVTEHPFSEYIVYTLTSTKRPWETKEYTVYFLILPPSDSAYLNEIEIKDLPAGTQVTYNAFDQGTTYILLPQGSTNFTFTPVFNVSDYATTNLKSGEPIDFKGSFKKPVELIVTSENKKNKNTYKILVGVKEETANYKGHITMHKDGQASNLAGREVSLIAPKRIASGTITEKMQDEFYFGYTVLATAITDANGNYEIYTAGLEENVDMKSMAIVVKPEYDKTLRGFDSCFTINTQEKVEYLDYAIRVKKNEVQELHVFGGGYSFRTQILEDGTNNPIEGATLSNYTGIRLVTGADGWTIDKKKSSQDVMQTILSKYSSAEFVASKNGFADVTGIRVELTQDIYEQMVAGNTIIIPTITMARARTEALVKEFVINGNKAIIDHDAGTIILRLPYTGQDDLKVAYPIFELSDGASGDRRSGNLMNLTNSETYPLQFTVTAEDKVTRKTYSITVTQELNLTELFSGTLQKRENGTVAALANKTVNILNSSGAVIATVNTDVNGQFEYLAQGDNAQLGVYIHTEQAEGKILNSNQSGFEAGQFIKLTNEKNKIYRLAKMPNTIALIGSVKDSRDKPVSGVSINAMSKLAETASDGSFNAILGVDTNILKGSFISFEKDKYEAQTRWVNLDSKDKFLQLIDSGTYNIGTVVMRSIEGTPVQFASVTTIPTVTRREQNVEVHAKVQTSRTIHDGTLRFTIPNNVSVIAGSISNPDATMDGKDIVLKGKFLENVQYSVIFWVKANVAYKDSSFVVGSTFTENGNQWPAGSAEVLVADISLEIPQQVNIQGKNSAPFAISGQATVGEGYTVSVDITAPDGTVALTNQSLKNIPAKGIGLWYRINDVQIKDAYLKPGVYTVTAVLKNEKGKVMSSTSDTMVLKPGALKLINIIKKGDLFSANSGLVKSNSAYLTGNAYVDLRYNGLHDIYIQSSWENVEDVESVRYVMNTTMGSYFATPTINNGTYGAVFKAYTYKGVGLANIVIELTMKDGTVNKFLIGRLTLLLDPSGYVFDKKTLQPIEGAMVTLEEKVDGNWQKWNATEYGQANPQTTDAAGAYGWFVPEGKYRVIVSAEGYKPYSTDKDPNFGVINVLPPRDDINIGLEENDATLKAIKVDTSAMKQEYIVGETIDFENLVVTAQYTNGTKRELAKNEYTLNPNADFVLDKAGDQLVEITYSENKVEVTATVAFAVKEKEVTKIELSALPEKTTYLEGETLSLSGMAVTVFYNNGHNEILDLGAYTTSIADGTVLTTLGRQPIEVIFGNVKTSFDIIVEKEKPASIEITKVPTKNIYKAGEKLELAGLEVTAKYTSGKTEIIDNSKIITSISEGQELLQAGIVTVRVVYKDDLQEYTAAFEVTVEENIELAVPVEMMIQEPIKLSYTEGEALDLKGLQVNVQYSDGTVRAAKANEYSTNPSSGTILKTVGKQTVTVKWTDGTNEFKSTFTVEVKAKPSVVSQIKQVVKVVAKTIKSILGKLFK